MKRALVLTLLLAGCSTYAGSRRVAKAGGTTALVGAGLALVGGVTFAAATTCHEETPGEQPWRGCPVAAGSFVVGALIVLPVGLIVGSAGAIGMWTH